VKKAIAFGALLLAAVIFAWRDHAPAPAEVERAPIIYPTPAPVVNEPVEPIKPPANPAAVTWGPCEDLRSSRIEAEDAWLKKVLASTVQDDTLFGVAAWSMEAANCAARRERLTWMR